MRCYRVRFEDTSGGRQYVVAFAESRLGAVEKAYRRLNHFDVLYPAKPHTTRLKSREEPQARKQSTSDERAAG